MIRASGLHMVFNPDTALENHAVRNVDFEVSNGEFVTLIGSNGSGKSTLLRILSGEQIATKGTIQLEHEDVTKMPHHRRARYVAQVFQDPLAGTCAELSIVENMSLAAMRGTRRGMGIAVSDKRRADFQDRLSILGIGLENRLDDRVGLLSGGQRQALSLIMTTLAPSQILLLDEHTAALDPRMSAFVLELTKKIYQEFELTVVMVTHSLHDALQIGNRTVMMHLGEIKMDLTAEAWERATPQDLFDKFNQLHAEAESPASKTSQEKLQ